MKRIFLLIATNLAIMLVLSIAIQVLGLNRWIVSGGLNLTTLLAFCAVFGFGGAFISLLISRPMAKWSTGAKLINGSEGEMERWLVGAIASLSDRAGLKMPEVAIYEGQANAFATGATKNSALVAVSTGLLNSMSHSQVEAVLAHEIAHIKNGDMITMTLLQGVMNTFVMFFARVIGYAIDKVILKNDSDRPGIAYSVVVVVLDLVFGVLAAIVVATFSRHREFRADAGAAHLMGDSAPMISALQVLGSMHGDASLPKNMQAFGISGRPHKLMALFASHPPIEQRIEALRIRSN